MRKANRKEYEAIIKVKSLFQEQEYWNKDFSDYEQPEMVADLIWKTVTDYNMPYVNKVALVTVATTGCFYNGNQFFMPSTADCCKAYKKVEKKMKKGARLFVSDKEEYNYGWKIETNKYDVDCFTGIRFCERTVTVL